MLLIPRLGHLSLLCTLYIRAIVMSPSDHLADSLIHDETDLGFITEIGKEAG